MYRTGELFGQRSMDQPLPLDTTQPGEGRRNNFDSEMRLAFGTSAGMAGVPSGIIDDFRTSLG